MVNPINTDDLINLRAWQHQDSFVRKKDLERIILPFRKLALADLPVGFGLDKFGLVVQKEHAVALPETNSANVKDQLERTNSTNVKDQLDSANVETNFTQDTMACPAIDGSGGRTLRLQTQKPSYQETSGGGTSKPKGGPAKGLQKRCCPAEVPSSLLAALDKPSAFRVNLPEHNSSCLDMLCVPHLRALAKLLSTVQIPQGASPFTAGVETTPGAAGSRRRACSMPDISDLKAFKWLCHDEPGRDVKGQNVQQPIHDPVEDAKYRSQMLTELKEKMDQTKAVCGSHGEETDKLIYALLQSSKQPNTDEAAGKVEALLLSGDEAGSIVESGTINAPIFTDQQQQFQWSSIDRPIAQLFRRMVDIKRTVSVQIPSCKATLQSYESHKLAEIQQ